MRLPFSFPPDQSEVVDMSAQKQARFKELTGRHILLSVIAFFAVLFIVNGAFIYAAVTSFRGEDVERSYRQGLDYNQTLDDRREQADLGWKVTVNVNSIDTTSIDGLAKKISLRITDAQGRALSNLTVTGRLRHPVDTNRDVPLSFKSGDPIVSTFSVGAGRWTLEGEAVRGDNRFAFRKDIVFE